MANGIVEHIMISGEGANHLELIASDPVPSDFNSLYPPSSQRSYLAIEPWNPVMGAAPAAGGWKVKVDKSQIVNGGGEVGVNIGWTPTGDVTTVTSPVNSGIFSFQFNSAEGASKMTQATKVRAGEKITVTAAIRGDTGTMKLMAYIPELGLYLTTGSTWTSTPTDFATHSGGGAWSVPLKSPTVPAYDALIPGGVYALILTVYVTGGTGNADDIYLWHWTDTAAILGHNVKPAAGDLELRCSDDNFVSNDVLVFTWLVASGSGLARLQWPTSYAFFTMRGERWWSFELQSANPYPVWYGQLALSQRFVLARNPNYATDTDQELAQVRQATTGGVDKIFKKEDIQRRAFVYPFSYHGGAQWQEARNRIFYQSVFGNWPILMIHDDTDPESCALVRPPRNFKYRHSSFNVKDAPDLPLNELAYPVFDFPT